MSSNSEEKHGELTTGGYKCPCCNNPWANGEFFAKYCQDCSTDENKKSSPTKSGGGGLSRDNMDFSVKPKDNFFYYVNGKWMEQNPIPAGYPSWNSFLALHVQSQEHLKSLLEELSNTSNTCAGDEKEEKSNEEETNKVAWFYETALNEDAIETHGLAPLQPVMDLIQQIVDAKKEQDNKKFAALLGQLAFKYGINVFMGIGASPDNANSEHTILNLCQGGLGLPDRDYYMDEDKQEKRDLYKKHITEMLQLGSSVLPLKNDDETAAEKIFDLELSLAQSHMTKTENRDPHATYNKQSITQLMEATKSLFDFESYLLTATNKATIRDVGDFNVRNVKAIETAATLLSTIDPITLQYYLQYHTLKSCAPYLTKALVQEHFDFFETILSGTAEMKPRWKRAMAFTESALGEALGKLYCARYFDETSKERALAVVESVRQALQDRLSTVDWMKSDSTREQALLKMSKFRVKIGYPNKWIDYSPLQIEKDEPFLSMVFKAREFDNLRESKEMNAPTDREKWFLTPQTVNAYYHPSLNEIVFPAAILQHPFFDKDADDAVNFGAMGAVVGHEMTHGFDDKGRKFDYAGTMKDWWSKEDAEEYEARVKVMVDQASKFEVHGQFVKGELTCGENIADLGGIRLAYAALQKKLQQQEESKSTNNNNNNELLIDGFTPTQRFFMSWAQCWRQNVTKERSLQLLTLDPHGPNELRCNGPLSNIPEFHQAFDVAEGDPMYKPVDSRVDIW